MLAAFALPLVAAVAATPFEARVLVAEGDDAPDGGVHERFTSSQLPTLTESNDVFVRNIIANGTRDETFLRLRPLGEPEIAFIEGTPLDGGGTSAGDLTNNPIALPDGRIAFATQIGGVPSDQDRGFFLLDPDTGTTTQIARERQAVALPDGSTGATLNSLFFGQISLARLAVNASGEAAFNLAYTGPNANGEALFRTAGPDLSAVFVAGDPIPVVGDPSSSSSASSFELPDLNNAGTSVFRVNGSPIPSAYMVNDGQTNAFLLRSRQALMIGDCTIGEVLTLDSVRPAINNAGQIAVDIDLDANIAPPFGCPLFLDGSLLLRFEPDGGFNVLARRGTPFPGTTAEISTVRASTVTLNEAGAVATEVNVGGLGAGLIVADGQTITRVALQEAPAPGGGTFRGSFTSFAFNDAGQVAFVDQIIDAPGATQTFERGLFLYTPGVGTELVLSTTQPLDGLDIVSIEIAGNGAQDRRDQSDGINNAGLIAFQFDTADGGSGIAIAGDNLPPLPCNAADIAVPSGVLDLSDIDAFVVGFAASDPVADLAPPAGTLDLSDIDAFITGFLAGCP